MLSGQKIKLRAWCEDDLPELAKLRNDVELQASLMARVRGSTIEQVRGWLAEKSRSEDSLFFVIADARNDEASGFLQFTGFDRIDRHAELGICLAPAAQGKGLGGEALELVFPYLRRVWGMRKLVLRVRSDNLAAIGLYEKKGFEKCGTLHRAFLFNDRWHDVVLMEKFLEDSTETNEK